MSKIEKPSAAENHPDISRRRFLEWAWIAAGGALCAPLGYITYQYISPSVAEGQFGGVFAVGAVDDFPPNSVTEFPDGRFYLVRLADGGFVALYRKCTHLGCSVPWVQHAEKFICPCHGSEFEQDGQVLNPPAPRPLDRFPVTLEAGIVKVDTGNTISRDKTADSDRVYPS